MAPTGYGKDWQFVTKTNDIVVSLEFFNGVSTSCFCMDIATFEFIFGQGSGGGVSKEAKGDGSTMPGDSDGYFDQIAGRQHQGGWVGNFLPVKSRLLANLVRNKWNLSSGGAGK